MFEYLQMRSLFMRSFKSGEKRNTERRQKNDKNPLCCNVNATIHTHAHMQAGRDMHTPLTFQLRVRKGTENALKASALLYMSA